MGGGETTMGRQQMGGSGTAGWPESEGRGRGEREREGERGEGKEGGEKGEGRGERGGAEGREGEGRGFAVVGLCVSGCSCADELRDDLRLA